MKKSTIKWITIAASILIVVAGIITYFVVNKIKADQAKTTPVISESDVKTTAVAEQATSDTRAEVAIPILMYHHIRNYNDPSDQIGTNLSVPPENFKAQIDYLKNNGYTTITFQQLLDFPTKKLPEKPVIITFDDGYQDSYDIAYKYLKDNGQVGVFYIVSGYFGRSEHMTEAEVKEISDAGMEIGSHSVNHLDLTTLSISKVNKEVVSSKAILEEITGKPIISFCYPAGKHDDIVGKAVSEAGYLTATTTKSGISSTSEEKILLSRLRINPSDSITSFANKITN